MKMKHFFSAVGALAAVLTLAACGGGGGMPTPPTPGPPCSVTGAAQLVYPVPNSTVSAASTSQIVVAVASPLPANSWNFSFGSTASTGSIFSQSSNFALQISTPPPGSAVPNFANPTYESVQLVSTLPVGPIYVYLNLPSSNCTPAGPYGNFTTQ